MKTAKDVLKSIKDNDVKYVDLRFTDPRGKWQHVTFDISDDRRRHLRRRHHVRRLVDRRLEGDQRVRHDADARPGHRVHRSVLRRRPPWSSSATCWSRPPASPTTATRAASPRRPRPIVKSIGHRRHRLFRPGSRILRVRRRALPDRRPTTPASSSTRPNCRPTPTPNMRAATSATASAPRAATSRCRRMDSAQDMRSRNARRRWREMGVKVEKHHHEVASAQHELGMKFDTLTLMADQMQIYKYCIHQVAHIYGKTATFMPKPIYRRQRLGHARATSRSGRTASRCSPATNMPTSSETCLYYIGGIIKHAKAINAFTNPSTNSYKRLVPGYEAPVLLAYSARNRSASCRIPYTPIPKAKRVEVRFPDPMANPYLAFAAMLMAGLDGIKNKIDPGAGDGQGPLRPAAGRAEEDPDGLRLAARSAGEPRQGPRLPQDRRRVRRRLHRQLHRAEDDRSRCASR